MPPKPRPKKYTCDYDGCDKAYTKPCLLEQHKRSHTGERPFSCDMCNALFLRKSHLTAHVISHKDAETKPFHCSECGKGVNSRQHLKRHLITHTKSFKCDYEGCGEAFYRHQTLRHHRMAVHEEKLHCEKCDKHFRRPNKLAQHNLKYHGEAPAYQCDHPGCFRNFQTWLALQLHSKTDHPKIKCEICGKGCVGKKGLAAHMNSHDDAKVIKLWNCVYCEMGRFVKKADLIRHYNANHDGNIPGDLLKPEEKQRLEELLGEQDTVSKANLERKGYEVVSSDDDEEDSNLGLTTQKLLLSFTSTIQSGKSVVDLISSNYETRKFECPKRNCDRKFTRQHFLDRHIKWHDDQMKRIDEFLKSLEGAESGAESSAEAEKRPREEEMTPKKRARVVEITSDSDSDDLDLLIDTELHLLRASS